MKSCNSNGWWMVACLVSQAFLGGATFGPCPCPARAVNTPTPIPTSSFNPTPVFTSTAQPANTPTPTPITPHLIFSTYLGGTKPYDSSSTSTHTFAQNAASDSQGNTYITGATEVCDLLFVNAWQKQPAAGSTMSAFVAKYDPSGQLLWGTYLGGNHQSMGTGIAAMPDGGAAVVGMTTSDKSVPFPTMNPCQADYNHQSDYFVTVFDANGNVRYSTYLGGSDVEGEAPGNYSDDNSNGNNVAVDAQGLVYITGTTSSGGSGGAKFPVTSNALQPDLAGPTDAFLAIIDPGKSGPSSLDYASFLGGKRNEKGHSIAVNASGTNITVAGYTDSSDFPTTGNGYRSTPPPPGFHSNGFVAQFTFSLPGDPSSKPEMRYSTYLGADSDVARDDVYGMTMDAGGVIIATGRTQSADFPMRAPFAPSIYNYAPYLDPGKSHDQPFLVKLDPSLNGMASLVYSTFLGGGSTNDDPEGGGSFCTSVAVDPQGSAYVGGETNSKGMQYTPSTVPVEAPQRFPYTANALLPALQGEDDGVFMQVSPDGVTLAYSTFLGGKKSDRIYGMAADPAGNMVVSGLTFSADFPVKNPAQNWPGNAGNQNAFVTKFGR